MEITLEEIQKKFEGLPEDLKWAIMGANIDDKIIEISKSQGLNLEQMGQLSLEAHMEIFGFTEADKFEESVKKSLNLPDEKTKAIVDAVNEKIFKEIRRKMNEPVDATPPKVEVAPEKNDSQALSEHGIEIIDTNKKKENLPVSENLEFKKDLASISARKLSIPTQSGTTKTDHSLPNISPAGTPVQNTDSDKPKVDPYREIPE
jgi:hypothetical protein